ncbi:MFS transporter [Acidocella sp. MX-AZ02]|uniref:MFS transporter n=1 Tax=Acidocella sp. MX-AZ02 TaxID=1214225 RepID=UPI00028EBA16|nr:MFS transporter [Acidocella sp. MX-AZ02]EKM98565.1 major facilitator superfamily protein [Acidocella sp. MX-AZ02]
MMRMREAAIHEAGSASAAMLLARLERLPVSRPLLWARGIVGMATFFDGYTTLAIAYALPILAHSWHLEKSTTALIISSGYFGQLIGALLFGWLAERVGRLPVLIVTIAIFAVMSCACIFAWNAQSLIWFRFLQGIGTGGEVPVASAYVNEFIGARGRGRFFLLYELLFLVGLVFSGLIGYALVPTFGWKAMFIVGVVPVLLVAPLSFSLPESPRWLLEHGKTKRAEAVIEKLEQSVMKRGGALDVPVPHKPAPAGTRSGSWRELFSPLYAPRTLLLWVLWFGVYAINNGLVTWLPTLYHMVFGVTVGHAIGLGFAMTGVAVCAAFVCALAIDKVGRRRWYGTALIVGAAALFCLWGTGATTVQTVFIFATICYATLQTVTYSLYLYSAELYPTRLRAIGAGFGSAWLRLGSMVGPWIIGAVATRGSIAPVFLAFAIIASVTGAICLRWAPETSGKRLEDISP